MKHEFFKLGNVQWFRASFSRYGWFKPVRAVLWQYNGEVSSDLYHLHAGNNYSFESAIWGSIFRIEVTYKFWFFSFDETYYLEVPITIEPPTNLQYEILGVTNG